MKIAQIAPLGLRIPPIKYGGTERIISTLTEELVKKGHEVTLFASGDSLTSAKLSSVYPTSLIQAHIDNPFTLNPLSLLHLGKAYEQQDSFDIIHDHNGYMSLPFAAQANTPVVMTLHTAFTLLTKPVFDAFQGPYFVSISQAQRKPLPNLNYIRNIYHGLSMETYPFSSSNEGYLLYVGRISPQKGVHYAIQMAEYLNLPLILAGQVNTGDIEYFNSRIKPHLSSKIQWVGETDQDKRNRLMSKALAFIHPVTWREPFGLTLIEAMACGCPVIAFRRGSIPEIIKHGKTGFIVEDIEEMVSALSHIHTINRIDCRRHVLENFNASRMTEDYENVYRQVIQESSRKMPQRTIPKTYHAIQSSTFHLKLHELRSTKN